MPRPRNCCGSAAPAIHSVTNRRKTNKKSRRRWTRCSRNSRRPRRISSEHLLQQTCERHKGTEITAFSCVISSSQGHCVSAIDLFFNLPPFTPRNVDAVSLHCQSRNFPKHYFGDFAGTSLSCRLC